MSGLSCYLFAKFLTNWTIFHESSSVIWLIYLNVFISLIYFKWIPIFTSCVSFALECQTISVKLYQVRSGYIWWQISVEGNETELAWVWNFMSFVFAFLLCLKKICLDWATISQPNISCKYVLDLHIRIEEVWPRSNFCRKAEGLPNF